MPCYGWAEDVELHDDEVAEPEVADLEEWRNNKENWKERDYSHLLDRQGKRKGTP